MGYCNNPELENIYEISRFLSEEADYSIVVAIKNGKVFLSLNRDAGPELSMRLSQAMCCNEDLARIVCCAADNFKAVFAKGLIKDFIEPKTWTVKRPGVSSKKNSD